MHPRVPDFDLDMFALFVEEQRHRPALDRRWIIDYADEFLKLRSACGIELTYDAWDLRYAWLDKRGTLRPR